MFSKVFQVAAVALALSLQAYSHAAVSPALGVAGTVRRSDVQRPSSSSPCGKTNIAASIDNSIPITAAADGAFTVTVTSFNGGKDGSRQVEMTVDATGTGKKFVAATVSKNGAAAPGSASSENITASLPSGIQCTGGKSGNLCLASFKTSAGFGNCVVVQQNAGASPPSGTTSTSGTSAKNLRTAAKAAGDTTKSCSGPEKPAAMKARSHGVVGTRAPRAFRAGLGDL